MKRIGEVNGKVGEVNEEGRRGEWKEENWVERRIHLEWVTGGVGVRMALEDGRAVVVGGKLN